MKETVIKRKNGLQVIKLEKSYKLMFIARFVNSFEAKILET